jgi:hypothetical protein
MSMDTQAARTQHRPKSIDELRLTAKAMLLDGYSDHGIAAALGVAVEQVRRLVGCVNCE